MSLNKIVATPDLKSLLDIFKQDILISINCHAIATVQSFNSVNQTIQAQVAYTKTFVNSTVPAAADNPSAPLIETSKPYPVLVDCPVVILQGGSSSLTFPIQPGDVALIFFNDRDMDNFITSGTAGGPTNTLRMHSFTDAIALVGLRTLSNPIIPYDTTRVSMNYGTTVVAAGPSLVKIANIALSLGQVLDGVIDQLNDLEIALSTFSAGLATDPVLTSGKAAALALQSALVTLQAGLVTFKTAVIGALLE